MSSLTNYNLVLKDVLQHAQFISRWISTNEFFIPLILEKINKKRNKYSIFKDVFYKDILNLKESLFLKYLRQWKMIEYTLIAYEELTLKKDIIYTSAHLSSLADVMLNIAYLYAFKNLSDKFGTPMFRNKIIPFAVIALGKLGGFELNFSSDIDIIFVYGSDLGQCKRNPSATPMDVNRFFFKLAEKIKFYLSEITEDGFVFRVDLRLRPDGSKGPIALPLNGYENYYEIYGQTWERLMLLKARPSAGNISLGLKFIKVISPFIFRKSLDYKIIEDLKDIKNKINRKAKLERDNNFDLKLGKGGIREIEFIVQTLQILNISKNINIYDRNTINSLKKIKEFKILNEKDCNILMNGYLSLRKWEHLVQISEEQQIHVLPKNEESLKAFINRAGYKSTEEFFKAYYSITESVNIIFNKILTIKTIEKKFFIDEEFTLNDYVILLKNFDISHPEECARILITIIEGNRSHPRKGNEIRILEELFNYILKQLKDAICPEEVLNYFGRLFKNPYMIYMIHDIYKENPEIIKNLVYIFSINDYISELIVNTYSIDYIYAPKNPYYDKNDIYKTLEDLTNKKHDDELLYEVLRKKHKELIFNVYYAFLTNTIDIISLMYSLTALAEGFLLFSFNKIYNQLKCDFGEPITNNRDLCNYLVVGLGKLGSFEMNIGSDLDLIFLYESQGQTNGKNIISNQEFFSKLIQKTISFLSTSTIGGYLYKIDMRLRPSGSSGTLVTTLNSFKNYHKKGAMLWEKQVLLKGRAINESKELSTAFYNIKKDILFKKPINKEEIIEIYNMRLRIEHEKAPDPNIYDIKSGLGGLIDIEFIIELIQLLHGWQFPELQELNTYNIINKAEKLGLLNNRDYNVLNKNYLYYKKLENLIRGFNNLTLTRLPTDNITLTKIGKTLGHKSDIPSKVITEYLSVRNSTRACFNRIFSRLLN